MNFRRMLSMLLLGAFLGGCHGSPFATGKADPHAVAAKESKAGESAKKSPSSADKPAESATADAKPKSPDGSTAKKSVDDKSLQEVMAEVKELGVLDPEQQNKLLADLRETDPALWPLMVKQVHAAVAYRRKTLEQDQKNPPGEAVATSKDALPNDSNDNRGETAELPTETQRLGDGASDIADNSSTKTPGRLPPAVKTAKAMPKQKHEATHAAEKAPAEPAVSLAIVENNKDLKFAFSKTRDIRSIDVKSVDNEEPIQQASYESEADAETAPEPPKPATTAAQESKPADWRESIDQAIKALEAESLDKPKTEEEIAKQARLRMLYVLAGRREDAVKPIPNLPAATQDFWSKELFGLSALLDTQRTPDTMARAAEAKQHLGEGLSRLGELAPLLVRNLSFCTVVQSYGCYTPFKKNEFSPGQEVLLYAELENFGVESTAKGYHTALRSSYQILDTAGQRVADHAISTTEEYCQNPRRDFFIGYQLRIPARLNPGTYTLQLTIEDLKSQKVGQSSVELTIKGAGEK
jgi:hypothetical protein